MSLDCFCDYDPPEFYDLTRRKARKLHTCYECNGPIHPGETYEIVAGKWDGDFNSFKTCQPCVDLRVWMKNNVPCFCWAHGNMLDDVRDTAQAAWETAGDEVLGLRFGALRRIALIRKRRTPRVSSETAGGGA